MRIGLVTNHGWRATIDAFVASCDLAELSSLEHGLSDVPAGETVPSDLDPVTPRAAVRDAHRELAIDTERFDQVAGAGALRVALQDGRNANDVVASWRAPLESLAASRRRYPRY